MGDITVRFMDTDKTVRVMLTCAAVAVSVCVNMNEREKDTVGQYS